MLLSVALLLGAWTLSGAHSSLCGYTPIKPLQNVSDADARPHSWPWSAIVCAGNCNVSWGDQQNQGTIIGKRWVLSVQSEAPVARVKIKVGFHDVYDDERHGKAYDIKATHQFILNDPITLNLYETTEEIEYSRRVQPVCLPLDDSDWFDHPSVKHRGLMVGWHMNWTIVGHDLKSVDFYPRLHQTVVEQFTLAGFPRDTYATNETSLHLFTVIAGGQLLNRRGHRWYQYGVLISDFNPYMGSWEVFVRTRILCDWIAKTTNKEVRCKK